MISSDAMLEASVTAIVGVIFVVTLRQSMGLKVTPKLLRAIFVPNICFIYVSLTSLFLHEELIGSVAFTIEWIEYTVTRLVFAIGLFALTWILLNIEGFS